MTTYHRIADNTLDSIVESLEILGDEVDIDGFDVNYSMGVLTLALGKHGTYVLNKQPPNKQIWSSSPISGPKRFDYDEKRRRWVYHRDGSTLDEMLNEELRELIGREINVLGRS
ncbi:Frataxin [Gonapodya prolifera JEL478]|uniref:ferroxidase n=1 Tax=Gonapodya prolifera (strain JEL478) TaxID=1344416 RepID=A0A139AW16_GONPJ|nr:Frataxin [Gonapodya prolifera JEL478]|eukprot:KXS20899.1 Frataxin [Gonapodya prolifera JEL478]